ncbi:MAG: hypothetical protein JWO31_1230 [Phycisphaerales bacterium]|nr:hypothetical protein [Phycisphaerales bacterium]
MKAERRHELKENSLVRNARNLPELWREYGSKLSLAVILVLLAVVLVRLWVTSRAQERQAVAEGLTAARAALEQYRRGEAGADLLRDADPETQQMLQFVTTRMGASAIPVSGLPPETAATVRREVWSRVELAVTDALKNSTDPARQAEATLLRADANLHWAVLASLGDVPEAATRPALGVGDKPDVYLDRAKQGYDGLIAQAANIPPRVVASARFGLAAVNENRGNFADARALYEAVRKDGPDETTKALAGARLALMARLNTNPLIGPTRSPTTGPATGPAVTGPTATGPTTGPATTPSASQPAAAPSAAARPATLPAATTQPAATAPAVTQPTTKP